MIAVISLVPSLKSIKSYHLQDQLSNRTVSKAAVLSMPPSIRRGATYASAIGAAGKISQDSRMTLDPTPEMQPSGAHLAARRDAENREPLEPFSR